MGPQCFHCRRPPRQDDPFYVLQLPGRTAAHCRECAAEVLGLPGPEPVVYPEGCHPPPPCEVCACCRQALRWGDRTTHMRLLPEDVAGLDTPPGCYMSCPECQAFFRPVIAARRGIPESMVHGKELV